MVEKFKQQERWSAVGDVAKATEEHALSVREQAHMIGDGLKTMQETEELLVSLLKLETSVATIRAAVKSLQANKGA